MRERLELVRAGHEVGLAADLDEHADAAAVHVRLDHALGGGAVGALAELGDAALAQQLDGGLLVAGRLAQHVLAFHDARAGQLA